MVRHLAAQGSRVGFVDLDRERGEALAEEIVADGAPKPLFIPCDVTDTDAFQEAIAATARGLGTVRELVNKAANDSRHAVEIGRAAWRERRGSDGDGHGGGREIKKYKLTNEDNT